MRLFCILLFLSVAVHASGQFTDRYWTFGDSSGINFQNLSNPVPGHSVLRVRGTCASICDSAGSLLFYCGSPNVPYWLAGMYYEGFILNKHDSVMDNGDSLKSELWYQEMVIVPDPASGSRFYVFHIGESSTLNPGLFYSIVDLSYNNGLGRVVQKNIQLHAFETSDCLAAVKHGNGRDWWVLSRRSDISNNEFYAYLVTPSGVSGPIISNSGTVTDQDFFRIEFSKDGETLTTVDPKGLVELHSFDRCTGVVSLVQTVEPERTSSPYPFYWSCAFSPDKSKLYVTSIYNGQSQDSSFLFQYDLNAANIAASKDTLHLFHQPVVAGFVQPGPDGKIYLSCSDESPDCDFFYLYCDTTYNNYIGNLGVINAPDSAGSACDFQPFSFWLGGHKSYVGLPNNPNYELGRLAGSQCDTLTGITDLKVKEKRLFVNPNPAVDEVWVNALQLTGKEAALVIRDLTGKTVFSKVEEIQGGFLTTRLNIGLLQPGMYFLSVETGTARLVSPVIKY